MARNGRKHVVHGAMVPRFLDAIDELYAAALEPERWQDALAAAARLFGGEGAVLEVHDRRTQEGPAMWSWGIPEEGLQQYAEYYHRVCPRLAPMHRTAVGEPFYDALIIDEQGMNRSEFYVDFLRPFGLRYIAGGSFLAERDRYGIIGVHRAPRRGHVTAKEIDMLGRFLAHLRRAIEVRDAQVRVHSKGDLLEQALEQSDAGLALVDARGRLLYANAAAAPLIGEGGVLRVRAERLEPLSAAHKTAFARLLQESVELSQGKETSARPMQAPPCVLPSANGTLVSVIAAPLCLRRQPSPILARPETAVLLVLRDLRARPASVARDLLRVAYHLTPAETELALDLASGMTPKERAATGRVSHNTVRTHLARLRMKLGVRTQAQIASVVWSLVPRAQGADRVKR